MRAFDVVIPCYQDLRRVVRAVESAWAIEPERVIVVDDGSPEPVRLDAPTEVIRQVNAGPGAARNRGMEASSAPWVILLDSDDRLLPAIRGAIELADRLQAVGAVANKWFIHSDGRRHCIEVPSNWMNAALPDPSDVFAPIWIFGGSGQIVSRRAIHNGIRYATDICHCEDLEFMHRLARSGPIAVHAEPALECTMPVAGESHLTTPDRLDDRMQALMIVLRRTIPDADQTRWHGLWYNCLRDYARQGRSSRVFAELVRFGRDYGWPTPLKRRRQFWTRAVTRVIRPGAPSPSRYVLSDDAS